MIGANSYIIKIKIKKVKKQLKEAEPLILEFGLNEEYNISKVFFLLKNNKKNLKQLLKLRNYKETDFKTELKKYTDFLNKILLNNGCINSIYNYSNKNISLRKFTKTTSAQCIIRELRNFLLTDYKDYKDIDFINCITSIILFISETLNINTPIIKYYYLNREKVFNDYYNGDKEQAKDFINKAFFNSNKNKAKGNNYFEVDLLKEIKEIHNNLNPLFLKDVKDNEFLEVLKQCREEAKRSEQIETNKQIKANKNNIFCNLEGKILCNLYHYYENKALITLTDYIYKKFDKLPHSIIFDSLICNIENIIINDINEYLECLSTNKNYSFLKYLKVDIKPFKSDLQETFLNEPNQSEEDIKNERLKYNEDQLKTDKKTKPIFNKLLNYGFNTNEILKIIKNLLDPKKINIKTYDNNYIISFKTGFITNTQTKQTENLLIEYYAEQIEEPPTNIINFNNPEDLKNRANEFIKSTDEKIFIVKAPCGTGKTYIIINEVLKHYTPKNHKILYLTENNILNIRFTAEHKHFMSHTNKNKDLRDYNYNSCSIQSIIKVINNEYDLLIIDEIDSVFNSISENITFTNSNSSSDCFKMLCLLLERTPKIILLDQDIEKQKINLIESILSITPNDLKIHKLNINAFNDVLNVIHTNLKEFENDIFNDLLNNKKISIATASKTYGEEVVNKIKANDDLKNKNILFLHADTAKDDGKIDLYLNNVYITNDKIREDINNNYELLSIKEEHLKLNIDIIFLIYMSEIIKFYNIHIFLFTPSLKTGASLNEPYFNKVYCFTDRRSIIPKQIIQMILRSRQIIDKKIIIYTPFYYYNKIDLNSYDDETKNFNIKEIELKQQVKAKAEILNIKLDNEEIDLNYNTLQDIINYENHKKSHFYIYELINTLKNNAYNEPIFKFFNLEETTEPKDTLKTPNEDIIKHWMKYDSLNLEDYNKIKNKADTIRTEHEKGSYSKTANLNKCLSFQSYNTEEDLKADIEKTNNEIFYNKFINDIAIKKILNIKKIIKYNQETDDEILSLKINKIRIADERNIILKTIEILRIFKIDLLNFKKIIITNKQFSELFNIKTKADFKIQYKLIKQIFKTLDLSFKYLNKHTEEDTAKIEIKQEAEEAETEEDLKNIHFLYATKPEEEEEQEEDEEIKKWKAILEQGEKENKYKIENKNDKFYFNKRIRTNGTDGKKQDRILKFEVFKKEDGKFTAKPQAKTQAKTPIKSLKDYNKETVLLVSYKPQEQKPAYFIDDEEEETEQPEGI
jgi:hypothetical protein